MSSALITAARRIPSRSLAQRMVPASRRLLHVATSSSGGPRLQLRKIVAVQPVSDRLYYSTTPILSKDYPEHTLFPMPALSPTMESGAITSWAIGEGDEFAAGDVLCSIETDKASVDFEAQDDGVLAKILVLGGTNEDIAIGTPICVVVEETDDVAAFSDFVADAAAPAAAAPAEAEEPAAAAAPSPAPAAAAAAPATGPSSGHPLMPAARHLSESKGLDATGLAGTGKDGRVTKGDVLKALAEGVAMPALQKQAAAPAAAAAAPAAAAAAPAAAAAAPRGPMADVPIELVTTQGPFEDIPNNKMRKVIASRLTESKRDVPHFYTSVEVELDNVMKLRKKLKDNHDVKVSVNDLVIRCCALALRDVPEVNSTYNEKSGEIQRQPTVDVSVAVATPTGLITPIVPNTDELGLSGISDKIRDLATRARDGKLQPQEYQGGTFCVSNLGMFGIDEFSAVINPPQAAILAVGGGSRRIVPTPYVDGAEEQAKPQVRTVMTGRLSADRRVVDEPTAALFLSVFKRYITEPELCLL